MYIFIMPISEKFPMSVQVSNTTELVDDGSAVAFLQLNGQMMSNILDKTSVERREEMVTLIGAAFTELQTIPTSGMSLSVLMDYLSILNAMNDIFQGVSTSSTYDFARVCCSSLKFSKLLLI